MSGGEKEADFMIKSFGTFHIFGQEIHITTTHISLFILTAVLVLFALVARREIRKATITDKPTVFGNIVELIVEKLDGMVAAGMGKDAIRFANYIGSVFIFILVANVSGLFGLRPPTADYGVTLPLGVITFFIIHYCGIKKNKGRHFTALFKPVFILFPINLIGEIAVPLSLSLRLFGNILSGTVMMGLIYGLLPVLITMGMPSVLHIYFDIFSGCIQAYVFCMLTMTYVEDKIGD